MSPALAETLFDDVRSERLTPDLNKVAWENPDVIFYEAKMYSKFGQQDRERRVEKRGWRRFNAART